MTASWLSIGILCKLTFWFIGEDMAKKRREDFLAPVGDDPGADYIRRRLKRRVELEIGITMTRRAVDTLLRCLDKAASYARISELHGEVLAETSGAVWALEIEPLLAEMHGSWKYEGRAEVLREDLERAARHYSISHTMDALLKDCDFLVVRTREERLDDAAWYAIPPHQRG